MPLLSWHSHQPLLKVWDTCAIPSPTLPTPLLSPKASTASSKRNSNAFKFLYGKDKEGHVGTLPPNSKSPMLYLPSALFILQNQPSLHTTHITHQPMKSVNFPHYQSSRKGPSHYFIKCLPCCKEIFVAKIQSFYRSHFLANEKFTCSSIFPLSSQQIFKVYCGDDQLIGPDMLGILHFLVIVTEKCVSFELFS